ncbi:thioredoxin family protein [Acidihalobacter prosperus]
MGKHIQLLVSEWCPTCPQAERLWQQAAEDTGSDLDILDVTQRPGRDIVAKLMIRSIPAAVIDGRLEFLGVPELKKALDCLH